MKQVFSRPTRVTRHKVEVSYAIIWPRRPTAQNRLLAHKLAQCCTTKIGIILIFSYNNCDLMGK
jgi:hypothetical protein